VIEGLDNIEFLPRGSFAILLKVHHAAVDGIAALKALERLHDRVPGAAHEDTTEPESDDRELPPARCSRARDFTPWARRCAGGASRATWYRRWRGMVAAVREQRGTRSPGAVNTRFNGRVSSYRVVESTFFRSRS